MEDFTDLIFNSQKLPNYLKVLLQEDEEVLLVYHKKNEEPTLIYPEVNNTRDETLNLTGTPLIVDLNIPHLGNDSIVQPIKEEYCYVPLELHTARTIINSYNLTKENTSNSIYCICDGSDEHHVVLIGSKQFEKNFIRTLVFALDCVNEDSLPNELNNMMEKHTQNVDDEGFKMEIKVNATFEIYGHKVENFNDNEVYQPGCIIMEAMWNSFKFHIPDNGASIQLIVQVSLENQDSILFKFYQDLNFIENCLNELSYNKNISDSTTLSNILEDTSYIFKEMSNIFTKAVTIPKSSSNRNKLFDALKNLEVTSFTDKLWDLLKYSRTVGDLKQYLYHLFDIICEQNVIIQVFENDKESVIGKMVNDLSTGRINIPFVNSKQALELLVELGIQKMHKRYLTILKCFDSKIDNEFISNCQQAILKLCETKRGTFGELKTANSVNHLQLLLKMHISLEFLQLVEQKYCFLKTINLPVLDHALKCYLIGSNMEKKLTTLNKNQLYELVVPLISSNIQITNEVSLTTWQLQLISFSKTSSVLTSFYCTKKPFFSDTIYNYNCDINETVADKQSKYYITRLERYTDEVA